MTAHEFLKTLASCKACGGTLYIIESVENGETPCPTCLARVEELLKDSKRMDKLERAFKNGCADLWPNVEIELSVAGCCVDSIVASSGSPTLREEIDRVLPDEKEGAPAKDHIGPLEDHECHD